MKDRSSDAPAARPPAELFDVLWRLHLEAIRGGHYDVAYHILAAALHAAELTGGVGLVGGVEEIAVTHQAQIDSVDPPHRLSTQLAGTRGTTPQFTSLRATAAAMRVRLQAERVRQDSRASRLDAGDEAPGD